MKELTKTYSREIWVDNVKVIACVLVATGHFFQSMVLANVLPENNLNQWFEQAIYYFHVPLFFICSGYLYQKLNAVNNLRSWGRNVLKKLIALGIPYFAFSIATWVLKTLFSSSVNTKTGGIFDTLFIHPEGQYWYLYALFFLFFITPTFKNKNAAVIALILSFLMKVLGFFTDGMLSSILSNEIWFVIGMCMSVFEFKKITVRKNLPYSIILGIIFVLLSIVIYAAGIQNRLIGFILGLAACFSIVMMIAIIYEHRGQSKLFGILAKYTMPIFLMHTMFVAGLRAALFKLGIYNSAIHIILGISISFIGPIIAAVIMKKLKFLEFFLYPGKFGAL